MIYAEITRKQLKQIENGTFNIPVPDGVSLSRKKGSRACYFEVSGGSSKRILVAQLDRLGINWQDDWEDAPVINVKKEVSNKYEKAVRRVSRYTY
jgi:hypothetical protein